MTCCCSRASRCGSMPGGAAVACDCCGSSAAVACIGFWLPPSPHGGSLGAAWLGGVGSIHQQAVSNSRLQTPNYSTCLLVDIPPGRAFAETALMHASAPGSLPAKREGQVATLAYPPPRHLAARTQAQSLDPISHDRLGHDLAPARTMNPACVINV